MFKNKYLKQLQEVQARIMECQASIEKLNLPQRNKTIKAGKLYDFFNALTLGVNPDVNWLLRDDNNGEIADFCKYLHELGEYLINLTDYIDAKKRYEEELIQLRKAESYLKDKLGIY